MTHVARTSVRWILCALDTRHTVVPNIGALMADSDKSRVGEGGLHSLGRSVSHQNKVSIQSSLNIWVLSCYESHLPYSAWSSDR